MSKHTSANNQSSWQKLEFVFLALTIVFILVVFSFYFDASVFGRFGLEKQVRTDSSPLVQPQTESEISYVYANGQRIASIGTEVKFYHADYLGSSRIITDNSGNKIASSDNYPFGGMLRESGSINKYKFTGKELDNTGLSYFGARYYDSDTGRFTQIDPLGPGYAYAANNPMKFVDPSGMWKKSISEATIFKQMLGNQDVTFVNLGSQELLERVIATTQKIEETEPGLFEGIETIFVDPLMDSGGTYKKGVITVKNEITVAHELGHHVSDLPPELVRSWKGEMLATQVSVRLKEKIGLPVFEWERSSLSEKAWKRYYYTGTSHWIERYGERIPLRYKALSFVENNVEKAKSFLERRLGIVLPDMGPIDPIGTVQAYNNPSGYLENWQQRVQGGFLDRFTALMDVPNAALASQYRTVQYREVPNI